MRSSRLIYEHALQCPAAWSSGRSPPRSSPTSSTGSWAAGGLHRVVQRTTPRRMPQHPPVLVPGPRQDRHRRRQGGIQLPLAAPILGHLTPAWYWGPVTLTSASRWAGDCATRSALLTSPHLSTPRENSFRSVSPGRTQSGLVGEYGRVGLHLSQVELDHCPVDVGLDRERREEGPIGHVLVRETMGRRDHHLGGPWSLEPRHRRSGLPLAAHGQDPHQPGNDEARPTRSSPTRRTRLPNRTRPPRRHTLKLFSRGVLR